MGAGIVAQSGRPTIIGLGIVSRSDIDVAKRCTADCGGYRYFRSTTPTENDQYPGMTHALVCIRCHTSFLCTLEDKRVIRPVAGIQSE